MDMPMIEPVLRPSDFLPFDSEASVGLVSVLVVWGLVVTIMTSVPLMMVWVTSEGAAVVCGGAVVEEVVCCVADVVSVGEDVVLGGEAEDGVGVGRSVVAVAVSLVAVTLPL